MKTSNQSVMPYFLTLARALETNLSFPPVDARYRTINLLDFGDTGINVLYRRILGQSIEFGNINEIIHERPQFHKAERVIVAEHNMTGKQYYVYYSGAKKRSVLNFDVSDFEIISTAGVVDGVNFFEPQVVNIPPVLADLFNVLKLDAEWKKNTEHNPSLHIARQDAIRNMTYPARGGSPKDGKSVTTADYHQVIAAFRSLFDINSVCKHCVLVAHPGSYGR